MSPAKIAVATLLTLTACQRAVPQEQLPHFATFCVARADWPKLIAAMKRYGAERGLEFHGGVEPGPRSKPILNAFLARGYNYYFGDDLDLWIVSNPFAEGELSYDGISKKPWTRADLEVAHGLTKFVSPLRCKSDPHKSGNT